MRKLADLPEEGVRWFAGKAVERGRSRAALVWEAVMAYRAEALSGSDMSWLDDAFGIWKDRTERTLHQSDKLDRNSVEGRGVEVADRPRFLAGFFVDGLDAHIAGRAAALRGERQRLTLADAVIVATPQAHGRILVTRNTTDFPANMPGIRVPDTL